MMTFSELLKKEYDAEEAYYLADSLGLYIKPWHVIESEMKRQALLDKLHAELTFISNCPKDVLYLHYQR